MFPKSETHSHNAAVKRIQIPENDRSFAEQVDWQEIDTLKQMNKPLTRSTSFHYAT
jgi:hypothetical protein